MFWRLGLRADRQDFAKGRELCYFCHYQARGKSLKSVPQGAPLSSATKTFAKPKGA